MGKLPPLRKRAEASEDDVWAWVVQHIDHEAHDDCWVWTGRTQVREVPNPEGEPRVIVWPLLGLPGIGTRHVRRITYLHDNPDEDLTGYRVRLTRTACDPACVNPEHLTVDPQVGYEVVPAAEQVERVPAMSPWDTPRQYGPHSWRTPRETYLRAQHRGDTAGMARVVQSVGLPFPG